MGRKTPLQEDCREDIHVIDRKGRSTVRLELGSLGRDSENKGDYVGRNQP